MVYAFAAVCAFLFFPLIVSGYFYFDDVAKKPLFALALFGVTVFGGYLRFDNGTIFIHYKENKAKALKLTDARSMKFKLKDLKYLTVTELKTHFELKTGDVAVVIAVILNFIDKLFNRTINVCFPLLDKAGEVFLTDAEKNVFTIKISLTFNIFDVLLIIIKTLWGNIWNSTNKKKAL